MESTIHAWVTISGQHDEIGQWLIGQTRETLDVVEIGASDGRGDFAITIATSRRKPAGDAAIIGEFSGNQAFR